MATVTNNLANGWSIIISDSDDSQFRRKAIARRRDEEMLSLYSNEDDSLIVSTMATAIKKEFGVYVYAQPVQFAKWYSS